MKLSVIICEFGFASCNFCHGGIQAHKCCICEREYCSKCHDVMFPFANIGMDKWCHFCSLQTGSEMGCYLCKQMLNSQEKYYQWYCCYLGKCGNCQRLSLSDCTTCTWSVMSHNHMCDFFSLRGCTSCDTALEHQRLKSTDTEKAQFMLAVDAMQRKLIRKKQKEETMAKTTNKRHGTQMDSEFASLESVKRRRLSK